MAGSTHLDQVVCPWDGTPEDGHVRVVSRHLTSIGVVVYGRCACGVLRAWLYASEGPALLARGARPAGSLPHGGGRDRPGAA